jgi:hypothetical protein
LNKLSWIVFAKTCSVTPKLKLALLAAVGMLVCAVPAASTHAGQPGQTCTSGASSITSGESPVTTWYPPGCIHP